MGSMGRQYHSKLVDKQKRFQDTPKGKGRRLLVPYEVYLLTNCTFHLRRRNFSMNRKVPVLSEREFGELQT